MMRSVRALLAATALCGASACAGFPVTPPRLERPAAPAYSLELQAYAAIESYRAALEGATALVSRPETPEPVVRALAAAEALATPAMQLLAASLSEYLRASAALERAPSQSAAAEAALAGAALTAALTRAEAPLAALRAALS